MLKTFLTYTNAKKRKKENGLRNTKIQYIFEKYFSDVLLLPQVGKEFIKPSAEKPLITRLYGLHSGLEITL